MLLGRGRDFVVLERQPRAGSWFERFPIHRQLNSINRRFTRSGNLEFNLRHDWNSLLPLPGEPAQLFGNWSKEYWPPADTLVEYINAFAKPQLEAGRLLFGHSVQTVSRCEPGGPDCRYRLRVAAGSTIKQYECGVLVLATGMQRPRRVDDWVENMPQLAVRYDQLSGVPGEAFENRSVLILGAGNAAAETADAVRNYARDIQVVGRYRALKQMKDTHYVGDVRARRTTHADAFSLKSYEGSISQQSQDLLMVPCGPDSDNLGFQGAPPVCFFSKIQLADHPGKDWVVLAPMESALEPLIRRAFELFEDGDLLVADPTGEQIRESLFADELGLSVNPALDRNLLLSKEGLLRADSLEQRQLLIKLRDSSIELTHSGEEFQKPYDVVVSALGWTWDSSVLDDSVKVKMTGPPNRQTWLRPFIRLEHSVHDPQVYPELNSEYESVSAPHLFVAGAAAHGSDRYRYKASGGFIHGFRFVCRTLSRLLERRYEDGCQDQANQQCRADDGVRAFEWPVAQVAKPAELDSVSAKYELAPPLIKRLLNRINEAAGPFEMVGGSLADAIVFDCKKQQAIYIEDLPEDYVHEKYPDMPRITWSYHYGGDCPCRPKLIGVTVWHGPLGPPAQAVCQIRTVRSGIFSNYIHPVLQYFPAGVKPGDSESEYRRLIKQKAIHPDEHPSTVYTSPPGVSRLHIKEAYIFLDWRDSATVRVVGHFMQHVQHAAAQSCEGEGTGHIAQPFDEEIDQMLHSQNTADLYEKLHEKICYKTTNDELELRMSKYSQGIEYVE